MNLVIIAAVIAVAGAAKLDRTYLPPTSAKTAGGSPGALQTPFASNSFNQGLGGIPRGGFENDVKGVVVDAAAPGTRASGDETGLGAPRIAYGSTNSKVGAAAFSGSPAGFRQFPQRGNFEQAQFGQSQIPDGQTAGTSVNAQSFAQGPGQFESNYQRSQELNARDQNANIVRFDSSVGTDSFSYSFETDNGISAEESGVATNGVQAQGGFSYTGDDGQVYSVTYTADEGGYQPKGDHLPTPPPIPEEILKSLEQNAKNEAAGLIDDGSYDAQKYNEGSDYTENDGANTHNGRPAQFGNRPESDASASGTFINQNNQPFVRPDVNQVGQNRLTGQANTGSTNFGSTQQTPNRFGLASMSSNSANGFGQASQGSGQASQGFGQATQGFGQTNQGLSNDFQQNRPSVNAGAEDSENANTFVSPTFETNSPGGSSQNNIQGQDKPQQTFGRPQSNSQNFNGQSSSSSSGSTNNNSFRPQSSNANAFGQRKPSSQLGNRFGNNEYLPPVNGFNNKPSLSTPQRPTNSFGTTQGFNQFSQTANKPQDSDVSPSAFDSGSQPNMDTGNAEFGNQKPTSGFDAQPNTKPSFGGSSSSQASGFSPFKPQSTAQPVTELTTPLEDNSQSQQTNGQASVFGSFGAQSSQNRPTQSPFGSQTTNNGASQFNAPASTSASAFASSGISDSQRPSSKPSGSNLEPTTFSNQRPRGPSQAVVDNIFGKPQSINAFSQNQPGDTQFAPSTQRPTYSQNTQAQGPDDSYYYNQPSQIFNSPSQTQGSRFPNTPSNQFNRVTQQPSFSSQSNAQASVSQGNFQGNSFSKQPQASSTYPEPPTLTSIAPTFSTQGSTAASYSGITQASASSFASGSPTTSTQFGSQNAFSGFGRRPSQQSNGQFDNQAFAQSTGSQQGFGKQPTSSPQSFSNRNQFAQQNSFQSQQSTNVQQPSNAEKSPAITSQQYDGEIYEYTKPAQTLPPPTEEDKKAGFGQFGRQPTRPQVNQQDEPQESSDSQSGSSQSRPQSAPQPSRPQFGQKTQQSQQAQFNVQATSRQQFGQQTTSFGSQPTQPSFAQTEDQNAQLNTQFNAQASASQSQQFGSRPAKQPEPSQSNSQQEQIRNKPCCRKLPNAPQVQPTQPSQFTSQGQEQFGNSDFTAQDYKPDQSSAQSFAGKGEVFGGPRKPPSFDEQTGYHY